LVNDWVHGDPEAREYWRKQVKHHREAARWSKEVREEKKTIEQVAARLLQVQLEDEFARDIPKKADGVYRDLPERVLLDVNWEELAHDLIEE
jgi:hypothetical protein